MSDPVVTSESSGEETLAGVPTEPGDSASAGRDREGEPAREDAPPSQIGRFIVRARLGAGAMGLVFEAHDELLDRGVAVKLLRGDDALAEPARARLRREAQTLAKLRHPNVVAVHEIGEHEGRIFVAMELVDGADLRAWLSAERRPWRAILRCFIEAGRGLVAAHAIGLVHRDFKPDNVLVGRDGSVRVADFGLARSLADDTLALDTVATHESSQEVSGDRLTRTGALLGTPAYMAPELFEGKPATAASDQFAFCVALFEALHGERPFRGRTVLSLVSEILEGAISDVSRRPDVPAWLDRVISRGLAGRPENRWPNMATLLSALTRTRERRRVRIAIGAAVLAGTIAVGFALGHAGTPEPCSGLERRLDGVWDGEVRGAVATSFKATKHPEAERMLASSTARLDALASAWLEASRDACIAAQVHAEQSPALHDRRVACLDRAHAGLQAAVEVLRDATLEVVTRADVVVPGPEIVAECGADAVLAAGVAMPPDPETRAAIHAVEQSIARVRAIRAAGDSLRAIELAESAQAEARALGHAPLLARASYELGAGLGIKGEMLRSIEPLHESILAAEEGHADLTRFNAMAMLARRLSDLDRTKEARAMAEQAEAVLRRVGRSVERETELAMMWGHLEHRAGRFDAAEESYARALTVARSTGDEALAAHALQAQGGVASSRKEPERARPLLEEALEICRAVSGDRHPNTAKALVSLGAVRVQLGDLDAADAAFRESLAIQSAFVPLDDPSLAGLHVNLGVIAHKRGRHAEALEAYERALAARERSMGRDNAEIARILTNIGYTHARLGDLPRALADQERALALRREAMGEDHPSTGDAHYNIAWVLFHLERHEEALAAYERAMAVLEPVYGREHPETLAVVGGIADCLLALGRAREVVRLVEPALATEPSSPLPPALRGGLEFTLAKALDEVDPRASRSLRARELAESAAARFAGVEGSEAELALVQGWLAGTPAPRGPAPRSSLR